MIITPTTEEKYNFYEDKCNYIDIIGNWNESNCLKSGKYIIYTCELYNSIFCKERNKKYFEIKSENIIKLNDILFMLGYQDKPLESLYHHQLILSAKDYKIVFISIQ